MLEDTTHHYSLVRYIHDFKELDLLVSSETLYLKTFFLLIKFFQDK